MVKSLSKRGEKALVTGSLEAVAQGSNVSLAESFLSVDAIVVVDMSGSMAAADAPGGLTRFEAAERELRALQQDLPGKIAVVAFSGQVQFCPGGIPPRMGGSTDMAAALRFVKPADGIARIILVSDGWPDSEIETLHVARQFNHKIDTVFIGPETGFGSEGRGSLQKLANETGGQFVQGRAPGLLKEETLKLLTAG